MATSSRDASPGPPKVFALLIGADDELVVGSVGRGLRRSTGAWREWAEPPGEPFGVNTLTHRAEGGLLAGTIGRGVMSSTDDGTSWELLGTGLAGTTVFAVLPYDGGVLAGTLDRGVAWLPPDGTAWQSLDDSTRGRTVYRLVSVRGTVVAATDGGVESVDVAGSGRDRWRALTGWAVHALLVTESWLYAGTAGDGLHRSADGGRTWQQVGRGVVDPVVHCLAGDGGESVLAGTGSGVAASEDGGSTWFAASSGLGARRVFSLALAADGRVAAGSYEGVWASAGVGAQWQRLQTGLATAEVYCVRTVPGRLLAGGLGQVWCSEDDADSWNQLGANTGGRAVHDVARSEAGRHYLATDAGLLAEGPDGSWSTLGLADCSLLAVALHGTRVLAGSLGSGLWCSPDEGRSWGRVDGFSCPTATALRVTSRAGVLATGLDARGGTKAGGVFRSDDAVTWRRLDVPPLAAYCIGEAPDGRIYVGAQRAIVLRSDDGGSSWMTLDTTRLPDCKLYALVVGFDGTVYIGTDAGVLASDDLGVSWRNVGIAVEATPYSLCVTAAGTLVAGTSQGLRRRATPAPVGGGHDI